VLELFNESEREMREHAANTHTALTQEVTQADATGAHPSMEQIITSAQPVGSIKTGIYFLIRDGRITYVGQGRHIALRIAIHAKTKRFDSWAWLPCGVGDLLRMERHYIEVLMPEDNRDTKTARIRAETARKNAPDVTYVAPVRSHDWLPPPCPDDDNSDPLVEAAYLAWQRKMTKSLEI
jgi:hypothetical protein